MEQRPEDVRVEVWERWPESARQYLLRERAGLYHDGASTAFKFSQTDDAEHFMQALTRTP
jgi:hypothetical protein